MITYLEEAVRTSPMYTGTYDVRPDGKIAVMDEEAVRTYQVS